MGETVKEKEKFLLLTVVLCLLMFFSFAQTVADLRPTVTMKEYVDMNIQWSQKYSEAQLAALKEAQELVRLSLQEYKTVNNEWRGQIKDQTQTYVTRSELLLAITTLLGLFWGYSKHLREKKEAESKGSSGGSLIRSGDNVEVKK